MNVLNNTGHIFVYSSHWNYIPQFWNGHYYNFAEVPRDKYTSTKFCRMHICHVAIACCLLLPEEPGALRVELPKIWSVLATDSLHLLDVVGVGLGAAVAALGSGRRRPF